MPNEPEVLEGNLESGYLKDLIKNQVKEEVQKELEPLKEKLKQFEKQEDPSIIYATTEYQQQDQDQNCSGLISSIKKACTKLSFTVLIFLCSYLYFANEHSSSSNGQNGKDGYSPLIYVDGEYLFLKNSSDSLLQKIYIKGNNGDVANFFVEDEMIKYSLGGTSNNLISKKDLQSTPQLYVKNNTIYSNDTELINVLSIVKNVISETFNNFKESETDSEYNQLDRAPGSNLIGRTYDPVRDKHGPSILLETYEKHGSFTNPITDVNYKVPDFVSNFDQSHESSAVASTELYENTNQYQKGRASEIGVSGGYGGFLEASVSSGQRSAMDSLAQSNTAVAKSVMYQKTYAATAEQNLLPYVKHDFTQDARSLPEFPDLGTNSSNADDIENIKSLYDDFSTTWGDFFVTSLDLGGAITMISEISNYYDLVETYSKSVVKAAVGGGWGPFSAKADVTNTVTKAHAEQEVKSNSKDFIYVASGSGVGDLDDPSTVVTNVNNWGLEQEQSHYDRARRSPVGIAETVKPTYYLMPKEIRPHYKRYLESKYGSESESLADITAKFNEESAKTRQALEDMKEEVEGKLLDIHIPNQSSIRFTDCYWVTGDELEERRDSTCYNSYDVPKTLEVHRRSGDHYWINGVYCCKISSIIN